MEIEGRNDKMKRRGEMTRWKWREENYKIKMEERKWHDENEGGENDKMKIEGRNDKMKMKEKLQVEMEEK